MLELDTIYEDFMKVLQTKDKDKAETLILILTGMISCKQNNKINEINSEIDEIETIINEYRLEKEFEILYKNSNAIFVTSPFYKRCFMKLTNIQEDTRNEEALITDITNKLYAPDFAEYFTTEHMPYISIC